MELQIILKSFLLFWYIIGRNVHAKEASLNDDLTPELPQNLSKKLVFPEGFPIGVASAAYQIEGGWNVSDKSESIWDAFTHKHPSPVVDGSNGDIACDSYNNYKEDVRLIKEIGLNHYRFSISWARILPNGIANYISQDGLGYYHNLLDELLQSGIEPMVTIYHWDHPQVLEKIGGWTNDRMVEYFADYARIIFKEFGHKVKLFLTINEPYILCNNGYGKSVFAPGINLPGQAEYLCVHNMLKAHARAYHIYDEDFRPSQNGIVGLALACNYYFPKNRGDKETADIAYEYNCGWNAHPIFSEEGDYPEVMKKRIAENSELEGLRNSRLPRFTKEWIEYIRGTADYLGLNHYTSHIVWPVPKKEAEPWFNDKGFNDTVDPRWPDTEYEGFKVVPPGFRKLLNTIKVKYNNPPVFITENGVAEGESFNDTSRMKFLQAYFEEMLTAIQLDECNVIGYTYWNLLDDFEWINGYRHHFGLVHVNFDDPKRRRTRKLSSYWLSDLIRTRKILPIEDYIYENKIEL